MANTYIPGVFTNANMHSDVHMLFEGTITEPILRIEPRLYRKFYGIAKARFPYYMFN